MAQISPKLFSSDLQKQIFPNNVFYTKAMKDIAAGNVESVDIPIAGSISSAKEGTPIFPLVVHEVEDSVKNYALTQIWHDPVLVKREEDIVLNYSKQNELTESMGASMATKCANYAAYKWAQTDTVLIVPTTGSTRASSLVGSTGNRKAITKADLLKVRNLFLRMNISLDGIIGVLTPDQYNDLLNIVEFTDYEKTGTVSKLTEGIVGRILGMDIMVRWDDNLGNMGFHYDVNGVPKANGTIATAATDGAAAMFFQPKMVRYAEAFPQTIINRNAPGYLGSTIIESVLRFGATPNRTDGKGVVCIREAA